MTAQQDRDALIIAKVVEAAARAIYRISEGQDDPGPPAIGWFEYEDEARAALAAACRKLAGEVPSAIGGWPEKKIQPEYLFKMLADLFDAAGQTERTP